jgi:hypothetical protein
MRGARRRGTEVEVLRLVGLGEERADAAEQAEDEQRNAAEDGEFVFAQA